MSLKRRMKRAVEKSFDRGEVVYANGYEITYKPMRGEWYSRLPWSGREAFVRINATLHEEDEPGDATIQELERLIEAYPYVPVFYNYLTIVYTRREMHRLAEQTTDEVLRRFPDYLFGRLNRAGQLLSDGDVEGALDLLGPSLELRDLYPHRKRYHVSEFAGFYGIAGVCEMMRGNRGRAAAILWLLKEVAPDENATLALARELDRPQVMQRLQHLSPLLGRRSCVGDV